MNSLSILSLTAALLLSSTPLALAQTNATGTVGVGITVDGTTGGTNASGTVDTDAAVDANVDENGIDLSLDASADGTIDASEQAAGEGSGTTGGTSTDAGGGSADTSGEGQTGSDASLDADGDGTVSPEEAAVGEAMMTDMDCSSVDFGSMMVSAEGITAIRSATTAQIVRLNDCEGDTASMNSDVESAVFGNEAIAAMLAAEGVGGGELRGITVSETSLTIYVEDDDMSDSADAGESTVTP